jgi:hypothetical protein
MSKNQSAEHNSVTDVGFLVRQINSGTVGVDGTGLTHHYWRDADTVVVYDETGVDHVQYLNGELLSKWVKYVKQKRSWRRKGPFASALIKADRWHKE